MPVCHLSKSIIDLLSSSDADVIWWDVSLKGFGLKITPKGRKVFLVQYRRKSGVAMLVNTRLGNYGKLTPHQARAEAMRILAERGREAGILKPSGGQKSLRQCPTRWRTWSRNS